MTYDSLLLYAVAREIAAALAGARVGRVFMAAEQTAVLEFSARTPLPQLLLCWQPGQARVHLAGRQTPARGLSCSFGDVLRRYLRGARLDSASQVGFDRVLRLEFSNAENLGPGARCSVVAEPISRWANAVLLDAEGEIREAARHVPAAVNRHRQLLPGEPYAPPPGADRPPLAGVTAADLLEFSAPFPQTPLQTLLRERLQSGGPLVLAELWARTGLDPEAPVAAQPARWERTLAGAIAALLEEAAAAGAWVYRSPDSRPLVYPVRLRSREVKSAGRVDSLSTALEELAAEEAATEGLGQQRQRLQGAVERGREQVGRRRQAREQALQKAREADQWREYGEALLANLWRIPPGASEAEVPLYTAEGERLVKVALNPNYPPQDNAQRYFERYKKARRAGRTIPALLKADRREEEYLGEVADEIERGEEADLAELEEELSRRGYLKQRRRRAPGAPGRQELPHLVDERGWTIRYGKTGLQNDRLVREAAPEDVWLHVRDGTGGHVLIRSGGRPESVPAETLRLAARLAAGLSRQRTSGSVEVARTLAKHVRKPKGTPPGFVLYDNYVTEAVEPLVLRPADVASPSSPLSLQERG
jgi:predicted ribosome quality control (RQC) complex YloA/Tae2 family protein